MGTHLTVTVRAAGRDAGINAIEAGFREVSRLESLLSSWRSDSDLSRINQAVPGRPVSVDPEVRELLAEAWRWARETDGAFDPTVGALIDAWDLRGEGRVPSGAELQAALGSTGLGHFEVDRPPGTVTRRAADASLTAGAFGKGAALRAARSALLDAGASAGSLDFGGQVLVFGDAPTGGSWRVGVAHPRERDRSVGSLRLDSASAATTSSSERFIEVDGRRFGHVLDPRTGRPVPDWGSVTVVARDALTADVLSTALYVLGPEEGPVWAEGLGDVGVLFLLWDEDAGRLEARLNASFGRVLEGFVDEVVVRRWQGADTAAVTRTKPTDRPESE